ncbi:MAG: hypothetical protein ACF8PN_08205 [Phycisphaerales bacterium]
MQPTDQERQVVQHVLDLFGRAKRHRDPIFKMWRKNYQMLLNRHPRSRQRPDWLPAPEVAEILPIVMTIAGWITDQRPVVNVASAQPPHGPTAATFDQLAVDLQYVLDASFHANREQREIGRSAIDAVAYGTSIFKTYWDPWAAGGAGDATFCRVSPFNFYPDPIASDETDGNYYIEARQMSLQELDRRFPGTYEMFTEGLSGGGASIDQAPMRGDNTASSQEGPIPGSIGAGHPGAATTRSSGSNRMDERGADRIVTVLECWVREHEIVDIVDQRTGKEKQAASDEWRLLVVADNRLVYEATAKDLWDHGRHPYDRFPYIDLGDGFWGLSMVEMLSSPQTAYNRLLAAFQHNAELTGNPMLRRPKGQSRTPLRNKPGSVIETAGAADQTTDWLTPPPLQMAMVSVLEFYLKRMEAISGLTAVVKGSTPSGRNAEGVVDAVQEAAFVRIRSTLRHLEYALRGVFDKKASLVCSNYTTPRMVTIAGRGAERSSIAIAGGHFLTPTPEGRVPLVYSLNVDAGAEQHTARSMREDRAIQLFTLGAYDQEALLEELQVPNWQTIAERVQSKMEAGAMAAPGARQRARA